MNTHPRSHEHTRARPHPSLPHTNPSPHTSSHTHNHAHSRAHLPTSLPKTTLTYDAHAHKPTQAHTLHKHYDNVDDRKRY